MEYSMRSSTKQGKRAERFPYEKVHIGDVIWFAPYQELLFVAGRSLQVAAWKCYGLRDGKIFHRYIGDDELRIGSDAIWKLIFSAEAGTGLPSWLIETVMRNEVDREKNLKEVFCMIGGTERVKQFMDI